MPSISIITPTNNSAKTIKQSVVSLLSQSFQDFEHVVIDNLSNDNTIEIIKELYNTHNLSQKLRIISEKDKGISDAYNKGIQISKGEIVGILNSDDYYFDESVLEKVCRVLENQNYLFAHGDIYFIDDIYGSNVRKPLLCPVHEAMPFNHPTIFFRRSLFRDMGLYDTEFKFAMDFELICRLSKSIKNFSGRGFYLQGNPLIVMRGGGVSWTFEIDALKEERFALIKHSLWSHNSRRSYFIRRIRLGLKKYLSSLGLTFPVKLWRNYKWNRKIRQ